MLDRLEVVIQQQFVCFLLFFSKGHQRSQILKRASSLQEWMLKGSKEEWIGCLSTIEKLLLTERSSVVVGRSSWSIIVHWSTKSRRSSERLSGFENGGRPFDKKPIVRKGCNEVVSFEIEEKTNLEKRSRRVRECWTRPCRVGFLQSFRKPWYPNSKRRSWVHSPLLWWLMECVSQETIVSCCVEIQTFRSHPISCSNDRFSLVLFGVQLSAKTEIS